MNSSFIIDDIQPLIPEGKYRLAFVRYETGLYFTYPKLAMRFKIVDHGEYFGLELPRYYNVKKFIGKPGKNGSFKPAKGSDFALEFCTCFPTVQIRRLDRIPMSHWKNDIFIGEVRTTIKNRVQRELPEQLQYSVISQILGIDDA